MNYLAFIYADNLLKLSIKKKHRSKVSFLQIIWYSLKSFFAKRFLKFAILLWKVKNNYP